MAKRSASSARATRTAKSARRTRRRINYSDIPALSDKQLRSMHRLGRPPIGEQTRQLVAIRIDPDVLDGFRKEAEARHIGYQTLIHEVLAKHLDAK